MLKKVMIVLFIAGFLEASSINLVVFSRNRPLQLDAFLESLYLNCAEAPRITVVYRADDTSFAQGYKITKNRYPQVQFLRQRTQPPHDFKTLTLQAIDFNQEEFIIFAVDDIIVTRPFKVDLIIDLLNHVPAEGFYLRLGEHITECYSENRVTGKPPLLELLPNVLCWEFKSGQGDWGYPHSVDMVVYRKKDIKHLFERIAFNNPNTLESAWSCSPTVYNLGLCFKQACMVNCPLNIVQSVFRNRHSNECTPEELLELYKEGYKLDIAPLQQCMNKAPHMDYKPTFIKR